MDCLASLAMTWIERGLVGWVERSETHHPSKRRHRWVSRSLSSGRPTAGPVGSTHPAEASPRHSAIGRPPRNLAAPIPPQRNPNGLRIVQLYPLFSRIYGQNRLETLRTSDVGTIDH